jgi:branched-chain amino acid aminotransferase
VSTPTPPIPTVWLNGELLPEPDVRISPFDHGLLVGDGVFETCKVVNGTAFALTRHLDRLARSAEVMGLAMPSAITLRRAVAATIDANGGPAVDRLRITVTAGPGPLGSGREDPDASNVFVLAMPMPEWPAATPVVTVPWPRNERGAIAGVKTVSYGENVVALAYAHERGASEALFANLAGNLCEGTGTNVFVGIGGRLVTPPLSAGCLAGVTRALLLELGVAEEADVPMAEVAGGRVQEAFLSSSTREVQPISSIDDHPLGSCPGPLTQAAADAFADLLRRDLDP